jgi:molybdate transport system substrate-binding protein
MRIFVNSIMAAAVVAWTVARGRDIGKAAPPSVATYPGGAFVTGNAATSIDVLSTLALRGVLVAIADDFHARTGLSVAATYKSTNMSLGLIAKGLIADMTIVTREAIDELVREGIIADGSTTDLARSGVGMAVRAGATKPDIGSVDALRRTLLDAKSVAFSRLGASGIHFGQVIERLGIADEVRRKAHIGDSFVGEAAARGEAEIAVQQISELKAVAGIDIVGPLPDAVQKVSVFSAGIFRAARNPGGAATLIAYLADPRLAPVVAGAGLEQVNARA